MTKDEVLSLIDLLERIRLPAEKQYMLSDADPKWNMTVYLMKRHLTGLLVTPTSLARAAGVPYSTALRRVEEMRESGHLLYRPRTSSGRSFSVHPTQALTDKTIDYASTVKGALAKALGQRGNASSFYLGASYLSARIIPPPAPMEEISRDEQKLDILLHNDPAYSVGKRLQEQLSHLLARNVRFHRLPFDEIRNRALANARKAVSDFDIIAIDMTWIGEFVAAKMLCPLDDFIAESRINRADFHPGEWEGAQASRRQYGMPFLTNPEILFYRQDLFEAAGLAPPSTTGQLLKAAQKLHAPRSGVYGVSWAARHGTTVGQAFIQFLADFGQPILNLRRLIDGYDATHVGAKEFAPLIDTPRGHETAAYMLALLEFSPPNILEMSWDQQIALLNRGRVAMSYEWASRASRLSAASRNIGFLPHPVGSRKLNKPPRDHVSPIGGFALGIPANIEPRRMQKAWRAIEWFTSPEVIKLYVQNGGYVMPRFSVASDPEVRSLSPVISAVDTMAKKGQLKLWPRPPVAEFPAIVAILGEEIHDMLSRKQSARQALARAQRRVEGLMRDNRRY